MNYLNIRKSGGRDEFLRFEIFKKFVLKMKKGQQLTTIDKNRQLICYRFILEEYKVNYLINNKYSPRWRKLMIFETSEYF